MKRSSIRRRLPVLSALIGAPILLLIIFAATGASPSPTTNAPSSYRSDDPRVVAFTHGMTYLSDVPTTIPPNGVAIQSGWIALKPLTSEQSAQVSISGSSALATAKSLAPRASQVSQPLLASFTSIGTLPYPGDKDPVAKPILDVPVWLVTFTSPTPLSLPGPYVPQKSPHQSSAQSLFFHENIAIDARSGAFVLGLYTP